MIDDFKTAKELLDKTQAFADSEGINLAIHGAQFKPDPGVEYLKESLLQNNTDTVGLDSSSIDMQLPIYQVEVYTPKGFGKFQNYDICNSIKSEFPRNSFIVNDSEQSVMINNVSASPLIANETHNITVISIELTVIANN
jgi:hypothetical protein